MKACVARFESGTYTRLLCLKAGSHSVGAHTATLQEDDADSSDSDEDPADTFTNHTSYILTYLLSHDINMYHVKVG